MTNRISQRLLSREKGKLLIPFFTAGFPSLWESEELVATAVDQGADMIEIGLPFSDPLADGPEIQYSSHSSLKKGLQLKEVLKSVERIRSRHDIPLIFMGYFNPLLARGLNRFISDSAGIGVDGLIIPDLPADESAEFRRLCHEQKLATIFLVAPTSSTDRIRLIDCNSSGFVYAVTVAGVTGTGKVFGKETDNYLKSLRTLLSKKFVAGFGISTPTDARRLASKCDGVVIGSALVRILKSGQNRAGRLKRVGKFLTAIRKAI